MHLKAGGTASDEAQRGVEAQQLMTYLNTTNFMGNLVIMGDFNVNSSENIGYDGSPYKQYTSFYSLNLKGIHGSLGENRLLANEIKNINDVSYPYINQFIRKLTKYNSVEHSLFGTKWYYLQKNNFITKNDNKKINIAENYVRGLLFLNTLPFNMDYKKPDPFKTPEILHLFDVKAGFIHAPRLWVAYVGGLFWWLSEEDPDVVDNKIIGGGRGLTDPINWERYCGAADNNDWWEAKPTKNQYLPKILNEKNSEIDNDSLLLTLPRQVQNEFKKVFFDFINGDTDGYTSFITLKESLEIFDGDQSTFCQLVDKLDSLTINGGFLTKYGNLYYFNGSAIKENFKNYDNYKVITPVSKNLLEPTNGDRFIFLELKDNSSAVKNILTAFDEELIIVNTGYKIWDPKKYSKYREGVVVKKEIFEEYLTAFTTELKGLTEDVTAIGEEEKQLTEVFGSKNKDIIKLSLYRHCKNIYDKWVGGLENPANLIFQCGDNQVEGKEKVRTTHSDLAEKYGYDRPRLIHSFRFVSRSFRDIGDEMFINPIPISEQISDFPNTSAYSVITGLLNDNRFEFIALPTFINYKDDKMLQSVFTPQDYSEGVNNCGPTFVCVYTGQHSKNLDIESGKYPNDGFDMRCDSKSIPSDFSSKLNDYEDPVAVFEVNYSQQNQNFFKDITLDQSEFAETEESLKIIDDISMQGFENKPTFAGQNMYNVYSVRSYSTEIEMLGNPMIQPMMYFQLNNIPMFHGAYMIIRARHNIKPNNMTTWFTGTRIRAIETPVIDVAEAFMSLIETLDMTNVTGSRNASVFNNQNAVIGANCGEFKLKKPIVDGSTNFYNSKPIRDLIANFESGGNYNAYNNGEAGGKGNITYKPIEMTIAQIKAAQALQITNPNRIFAVGKYQLVNSPSSDGPKTFNTMVSALGFSDNTVFNAENQEKAGEWLIFKRRNGLKEYFKPGSKGTEIQLQKAITDLGLEFASLPLFHMGFINNNRSGNGIYEDIIGYNSKQGAYGGSAGNPSEAKVCAQDVAKALIETWKLRNNNKLPEFNYDNVMSAAATFTDNDSTIKITANDKSVAIIIGDSTVGVFNQVPNGLNKNNIDISFNKVGERVPWLVEKLKKFSSDGKKYGNTKYVFVSIGTNDGYVVNDNSKKKISELNDLIKKVYPNAKRIVVPGTYGWENVKDKTKNNQNEYYKLFTNLGFSYQYPNASAFLDSVGKAHDPKEKWFIASVNTINSIKNA
jgi:hypothetical protein